MNRRIRWRGWLLALALCLPAAAQQEAAPTPQEEPPVAEFQGGSIILPDPGEVRVNPRDSQRYVWIPPGYFQQGCAESDITCDGDERPRRTVNITRGFWMRESEVTVAEYKEFTKAKRLPMPPPPPSGPGLIPFLPPSFNAFWRHNNQPIVMVSWEWADRYCRDYAGGRLPTETEWEYAARAGKSGMRFGDTESMARSKANYGADTCCKPHREDEDVFTHAAPVKSFPANAYGLYDMLGNVWEWTGDWYSSSAYEGGDAEDPRGPAQGDQRVLRGGSYDNTPDQLRVSERHSEIPGKMSPYAGFRCIHLALPAPQGDPAN